jgi:hypothetical protein
MQIVRLEAENIKRLSAVRIDVLADSGAVVIAGENESGKSSTLDAIEMALAGERVQPPEPIRRGQEKAYVVVDLGDVVVTRRFTAKGSSLTVANKDGLRYPAGQTVLDGFYSKLTFDPLTFATAKADEQARILRQLAGLDTSDLDDARKKAFEARTHRQPRRRQGQGRADDRRALSRRDRVRRMHRDRRRNWIDAERLAAVLAEADKQVALATGACTAPQQRATERADAARAAARPGARAGRGRAAHNWLATGRDAYEERVEARERWPAGCARHGGPSRAARQRPGAQPESRRERVVAMRSPRSSPTTRRRP